MEARFTERLTAYARYQGIAVNPVIAIEENACYAPIVIAGELRVGDMWLLSKWPEL